MSDRQILKFLAGMLLVNLFLSTGAYALPDPIMTADGSQVSIKPDSPLYPLKIFMENAREAVTFNPHINLQVKQEHLQERLNELQYEAIYNNNKNSEKLLEKIQVKRMEIEEAEGKAYMKSSGKTTEEVQYDQIKRQNVEVLTNLINSDKMPEQSKKGLMNALNHSGIKISEELKTLLPFTRAAFYDPTYNQWYSIIVSEDDTVVLTITKIPDPEIYLYPTQEQVTEIRDILLEPQENGLTISNKIKLTQLYFEIKKEAVETK